MPEPAAAPESREDKLASLANSMIEESEKSDNPNAWEEEAPEPQEAEGEAMPEPVEAAEEAPSQSPDLHEIEIGGEKYRVPKPVAEGYMRDADYRQKTMALAEDRKATEQVKATFTQLAQQAQNLAQQAQQFAPAFGQIAALDGQIQAVRQQLTPELRNTDPLAYSTLASDLTLLAQHRNAIASDVGQAVQQHQKQVSEVNAKANQERVQRALPELNKAVPGGFTPGAAKQAHEYLVNSGLAAELNEVMPGALDQLNYLPKAVLTMWKAQEYDRMQASTKVSLKKVEGLPPVARPSAKPQSSESKARADKLRDEFKKSGGKDSSLSRAILRERLFGGS